MLLGKLGVESCALWCSYSVFFYSLRLEDFKEFIGAMEAVKDKGVVVAVASPDDVEAANKELSNFFQINKAL